MIRETETGEPKTRLRHPWLAIARTTWLAAVIVAIALWVIGSYGMRIK